MRFAHHLSVIGGSKQVAVTVLGHPVRASEMRLVNMPSAIGLFIRIEPKYDADGFCPMRGIGLRIEQAKIGRKMRTIVFGQVFAVRRLVQKVSFAHLHSLVAAWCRAVYG